MSTLTSLRASASAFGGAALENWAVQRAARQWGIFRRPTVEQSISTTASGFSRSSDGPFSSLFGQAPKRVLSAAHVESLRMDEQSDICTAPQENGTFTSYNKVFSPYKAVIRMVCDGSETGSLGENMLPGFIRNVIGLGPDTVRKDFLETLSRLVKDTNLYFVATPEGIYPNANITGYNFTRTAGNGVDVITANITIQEVRQSSMSRWAGSRYPQGAQTRNTGPVSLQPKGEP
ncbi:hypothetical protein [Bombella favorum]|uniref:Uncharacterized protein n=1 Tax=Bombella favorum TaxID=2039164 RepID=A0ABR5ZMC5_9PROT|nr:hypothetical protein [Bombella favorum]MBA5725476.1 hypothetical protein [Bombella favorum]